ncbi:type II toxin-antitoxin system RelE family toxin [Archaeoglobus profundus]|uniref:type II toxin-antitoxin system RelE family toxin n=1 Tax=Archaeoglobus profundus TaxID=84156 RepID=UPI00064F6CA9|nr:type II toxin-antitoxin system RelE/ParE family toxin [Archaeoglobus profundus]
MYRVKVHRDVEKFLRKIPKHDAERIREMILSLKDPFSSKPVKVKGEENTFRLRVGKYRILFFIDEDQKIVIVSKVDKRERVYDRL